MSENYRPSGLLRTDGRLIRVGEAVVTAGSCFASNLVPYLERSGLTYLRVEPRHHAFASIAPEALGYDKFSAAYGNIYTARQLLQLLRRATGDFRPVESRWYTPDGVIDPFRPGLKYHARNDLEFDALTNQHLRAVRDVFARAKVLIFTLGLTEAWTSSADGAVFPVCPGTIGGTFDEKAHRFVNFKADEIAADLGAFIAGMRALNPTVRLILTVSPVPLIATASGQHVLCASTYSKSVLRVAAQEIVDSFDGITYFPSYEIITGPQAPASFFEDDRRSVSKSGVDTVMAAFLAHCEAAASPVNGGNEQGTGPEFNERVAARISAVVADGECEEAMLDRDGPASGGKT